MALTLERKGRKQLETVLQPQYNARVIALLQKMVDRLKEAEFTCSTTDYWGCDDGELTWGFVISISGTEDDPAENDVDVTFSIDLSENCDGSRGGLSMSLRIVAVGGNIIGGLSPYNYTDKVFVPRTNPDAIEERFKIFEQMDPDITEMIQEWSER